MRPIRRLVTTVAIGSEHASAQDTRARDTHRTATILTLLVFLWGVIGLAFVPWKPFGIPNVAQIVVGSGLLAYLVKTWNRPRLRVAEVVTAIMILYALVRLPWAAVVWCRLGRPVEAFSVPQLAAVTIGLVYPGRLSHGAVVVFLFSAEAMLALFYAHYLGLAELVPYTEPFATFAFTTLGIGLLLLRQRSRALAQQHVRARAEIDALDRIRPLFEHTRDVLETQVNVIATEVRVNGGRRPRSNAVGRALDHLGDLRGRLGGLLVGEQSDPSPQEAERALVEHDAQLGATLLAVLGFAFSVPAILTMREAVGSTTIPLLAFMFAAYAAMLTYLFVTRWQPSSRRALWVVLALYATTLPIVAYNQHWLLHAGRPYAPFLGHKLLMGILGLTLATRFKLGVGLIAGTAANAVALYFVLDMGAYKDIVENAEPFVTLIYMLVGLTSLRLLERRQTASLQLLRDEAEASAMHRRALMFLAVRDRLNSPLQTLVLGAESAHVPARNRDRVQDAIDQLVDLSRELAEVDVPVTRRSSATAIDADRELRRRERAL